MPRFFATNRAMHHLGRVVRVGKHGTRHALARGGYYFVDMDEYMRFYLGTTIATEMPTGAIVPDSEQVVFDDFLADDRIKAIVVCVHGFNVELFEAFTWYRVLLDTMRALPGAGRRIVTSPADLAATTSGDLTAFVGFSWPSNGNVLSYSSDQREAIRSTTAFGALLTRLKLAGETGKSVNLICHSMGNLLACHTLAGLVDQQFVPLRADERITGLLERRDIVNDGEEVQAKQDEWLIDNYIMLAPDVERRHVTKCAGGNVEVDYIGQFYSGLQHLVRNIVNVYSRFDSVLTLSNYEKVPRKLGLAIGDAASKLTFGLLDFLERNPDQRWEKRLGSAPAPMNAPLRFKSVNATELTNRRIGHGDHIDARPVVKRIAEELAICLRNGDS